MAFVLDPVDTNEDAGSATDVRSQTCNLIQTNSGRGFTRMRERNLDAIGEARGNNIQVRMVAGQVFEGFLASGDDARLQLRDGVILQPGGISEVASHTTDCRGQPRIGVDLHVKTLWISGHGC